MPRRIPRILDARDRDGYRENQKAERAAEMLAIWKQLPDDKQAILLRCARGLAAEESRVFARPDFTSDIYDLHREIAEEIAKPRPGMAKRGKS